MMYRVINHFTDLQDRLYHYNRGDLYPRDGYTPPVGRVAELSGSQNRRGVALIEEVRETGETAEIEADTPIFVEDEPRKRGRKRKEDTETESE